MTTIAMFQTIAAIQAIMIVAIASLYAIVMIGGERRVARKMRAQFGNTGHSRAWTAQDGQRYRYDLVKGCIVRA